MNDRLESDRLAGWLLAGALGLAGFALIVALGSGLTFFQDEWNLILRADLSADSLLTPLNEHLWALPVAIYKLLLALFGLDSTAPFRVVATLFVVLAVAVVYVCVRARLGTAVALVVGAVLLALGPAWEHLLWPVEIGFSGAIAAGLGALIALERGDRRGDLLACAALVLSLAFSSLGLVFAVGAAVDVVLRGDGRLRRAFVPAVPLALYALWYAVYGQETESAVSVDNLYALPAYVWDAASSALASLLGLTRIGTRSGSIGVNPDYARPLLVALLIAAAWIAIRRPAVLTRSFWVFAATGLAFWASAGLNQMPGREPGASRYQLVGAIFIVLTTSELLRDRRPPRLGLALLALLGAASIASNLGALRAGEDFFRAQTDVHLAALAALEGARDQVDEAVVLEPTFAGTPFPQTISAGSYFAAVDRWGSPVADPVDALAGPEPARAAADAILAAAYELELEPADRAPAEGCERLEPGPGGVEAELGAGGAVVVDPRGGTPVSLRRFATGEPAVDLGEAPAGASSIAIPLDDLGPPWTAVFEGGAPVRVCRLPG